MSFKIIYSFILTMLGGMWDLSYQPGVEPVPSAVEMGSLNHWTARAVPELHYFEDAITSVTLHHAPNKTMLSDYILSKCKKGWWGFTNQAN